LIEALKDSDPGVRCEAILALLKCRLEVNQAIPELTEVQNKDPAAKVRSFAAKALKRMGSGQP
jgi:HEAT repeat protein